MVLRQTAFLGVLFLSSLFASGCSHIRSSHHRAMGEQYYAFADYPSAYRHFEHSTGRSNTDTKTDLYIGWVHYFLMEYRPAKVVFERILTRERSERWQRCDALRGVAWSSYRLRDYDRVRQVMKELNGLTHLSYDELNMYGWSSYFHGGFDAALELFTTAVQRQVASGEAYFGIASCDFKTGNFPEGLQAIDRSIRWDDGNPNVWVLKGDILHTMGNREESFLCYRRALDLDPGNLEALMRTVAQKDLSVGVE